MKKKKYKKLSLESCAEDILMFRACRFALGIDFPVCKIPRLNRFSCLLDNGEVKSDSLIHSVAIETDLRMGDG